MRSAVVVVVVAALASVYGEEGDCEQRCSRIHDRSLNRMSFTVDRASSLLEKQRPPEKLRELCWKMHDFFYCMRGCRKTAEHEKYVRSVKATCADVLSESEVSGLACLSTYRGFLELRCSSFMNEAVSLRKATDSSDFPQKDSCRFLHLNALCLENSVGSFCPGASPFFTRLDLRDHFLNFVLPTVDGLFDDEDLDHCQMVDFVKEMEATRQTPFREATTRVSSIRPSPRVLSLSPSATRTPSTTTIRSVPSTTTARGTIHIAKEHLPNYRTGGRAGEGGARRITVSLPATKPSTPSTNRITLKEGKWATTEHPLRASTRPSHRRIFESDEELAQTPPNFYYSSFRGTQPQLPSNYSSSFGPDAQFVTPIHLEASTIFGIDDSSKESPREGGGGDSSPLLLVRGGGERSDEDNREKDTYHLNHEDTPTVETPFEATSVSSEEVYTHGADTMLSATSTTLAAGETVQLLPPEGAGTSAETPLTRTATPTKGWTKEEEEEGEREQKEAREKYDEALKDRGVDDETAEESIEDISTTESPDSFTPLINGGRVAVKSIKKYGHGPHQSTEEWTGGEAGDTDEEYEYDVYITSETMEEKKKEDPIEVRRRVTFVLAYTGIFLALFIIVVCVILFVIIRNRRAAQASGVYKLHDSI